MALSATRPKVKRKAPPELILDQALRLFVAHGFDRTPMEEIARAVGVSRGALYLQFASKEEIFRAIVVARHDALVSGAREALELDAPIEERLRHALDTSLQAWLEVATSPHGHELLYEHGRLAGEIARAGRRRYVKVLEAILDDGADRGELKLERLGMSSKTVAELMAEWLEGLKQRSLPDPQPRALQRQLGFGVRLYCAALTGRRSDVS